MSEMKRFHPRDWAVGEEEVYLCSEADAVIALIKDTKDAFKASEENWMKLAGMRGDALAARDKTIEELRELVREAFVEGAQVWAMRGHNEGFTIKLLWQNESQVRAKRDSILGPHSDPPATADQSK